jgi:hypothetical protein
MFLMSVMALTLLVDDILYLREKKKLINLMKREKKEKFGKINSDSFYFVTPGKQDKVVIKSRKPLLGRTKCCLIYEIVNYKDQDIPLIWGSRVFLAIDVSINPLKVNNRKVTAKLILVKSGKFEGNKKQDIRILHKKVLRHFMHTHGQDSQWNLEKLGLNVEVNFNRKARAKLHVRLSRLDVIPDNMPIFYRYDGHV